MNTGFIEALLEFSIRVDLSLTILSIYAEPVVMEKILQHFNIGFICGCWCRNKSAKHGNYGVSSISGSSNVMEKLGIKFSNDTDFLEMYRQSRICVLHACYFTRYA
jgi:anthranilate phosphoribosyltransferase